MFDAWHSPPNFPRPTYSSTPGNSGAPNFGADWSIISTASTSIRSPWDMLMRLAGWFCLIAHLKIAHHTWANLNISLIWIKANLGMIPLTNQHLWWGRSEVVIIYPDHTSSSWWSSLPLWKRLEFVNWDDNLANWMESHTVIQSCSRKTTNITMNHYKSTIHPPL